jgi:hypothetical protein
MKEIRLEKRFRGIGQNKVRAKLAVRNDMKRETRYR